MALKDKDEGQPRRNEVGTARRDRSASDAPPALAAVRVAQEAFGNIDLARKVEELTRFLAKLREGKALNGEQGGASARQLNAAASALEEAHAKLAEIRLFELVNALRPDKPDEGSRGALNPLLPLRRDTEGVFALMASLEALPAKLRRRAASTQRGRGRPRTQDAVDFAVDALVALWCLHREDAPTSDIKRGAFGAMALDVLTSAEVGFLPSTVKAALARRIKKPDRSARKVAAELKPASLEKERAAPRRALVVVVDPDDQVGIEAAIGYANDGCSVTLVKRAGRTKQADQQPLPGVETIDAAPFTATKKILGALRRRAEPFDIVVVTGLGAKPGAGIVSRRGGLTSIDRAALEEHAVRRPAGLIHLLAELRQAKLLAPGARAVAVVSPHGVVAHNPFNDRHLARAAMRALVGAVRDISFEVPSSEWVVALVSEGWGAHRGQEGEDVQDPEPNVHRYPRSTAASLRGTIGRLPEKHHGLALELTGGVLPNLF
jgi:hypothetical protein